MCNILELKLLIIIHPVCALFLLLIPCFFLLVKFSLPVLSIESLGDFIVTFLILFRLII